MANWLKQIFWYIVSFINKSLRRKTMILPTVDNLGEFIDNIKIPFVIKFTINNETFFYTVINGVPHWFRYSVGLENWLLNSGVYIGQSISPIDELPPELVDNIPPKYQQMKNTTDNSGTPKPG